MRSRSQTRTVLLAALILFPGNSAFARSAGITTGGMEDGPATCSDCHGGPAQNVTVELSGPTVLEPDEIGLYRIEISETAPGGLRVGSGINIATFMGPTQLPFDPMLAQEPTFPSNLQIQNGELTHTRDVNVLSAPSGGVGVFFYEFPVRAPETEGLLTLLGALNSFDQNFSSSGDAWNRAALDVMVVPEAASALQHGASIFVLALLARHRNRSRKD